MTKKAQAVFGISHEEVELSHEYIGICDRGGSLFEVFLIKLKRVGFAMLPEQSTSICLDGALSLFAFSGANECCLLHHQVMQSGLVLRVLDLAQPGIGS